MKALRIVLWSLGVTLLTGLALVGALWSWSGHDSSLSTALGQAARLLPAGQTLEVKEVEGSLRSGGHIGWLRWQRGELSIEARDVQLGWTTRSLWDGELRLSQLVVKHLRIDDRRAPSAPTPPTDLHLPFKVDAAFTVETLDWTGPPALQLTGLTGSYSFNSNKHILDVRKALISSGIYQLKGSLQAQAPMALDLTLQGAVQTKLPSTPQPLTVQAQAEIHGTLAGPDAALDLKASLVPDLPAPPRRATASQPMQASVTARLQPWQAQRIVSADAQWQSLDLAALWPQAPQTGLSGNAHVTPSGKSWRAGIELSNTPSGPWDQQRLPLDSLNAKVVYLDGLWTVESLKATAAGGRVEATGKLADAPAQWQGSASVTGINPAQLDSRLASTVLDGQLTARQTPAGIAFETQLQAANRQVTAGKTDDISLKTMAGLRLKSMQAKGLWLAPKLTLNQLNVQTDDAQLQGTVSFDTLSQATTGQLKLNLPGTNAELDGSMASTQGLGKLSLIVTDAALASRWLARWPGVPAALKQTSLQGSAELTGQWQGGWQQQGQALKIQSSLRAAKLDLNSASQSIHQGWRLRDLQADLSGTLAALNLSVHGQADNATRHFALQSQGHGGLLKDSAWQASVDSLQVTAQDSLRPGLWILKLNEKLLLDWQAGNARQALAISAGSAQLNGPVPGTAALSWQPARWSQQTSVSATGAAGRTDWQTQGKLTGLPLAWLELLGQTQMANLGLRGDMIFGGQWAATGGDTLRLRAALERTSGDLQLQAIDATATTGTLRAGVREARLQIAADNEQVTASLNWDSERAGQARADVSTRLQRQDGRWTLPTDAPLKGTVRAKLPPVGAWSVLAPPGWRLRGTLDADATLSGTLGAPLWRGNLQANNVAVRSVVDGIDFSNGNLRASLEGQRINIDELTLQGAGSSGGTLSATGSAQWLPATASQSTPASRLRMTLDATAQALRVSTRADRRLVVSGKVTAQLADARLQIRGNIKADQALFTLPEDTTPQLGSDVVVRPSATEQARKAAAQNPKTATVRITPDVALTLDLGPDFQVRGRGLITRLAGNLELHSGPENNGAPRLTGNLRTVRGTYKAYGQQLDIERGVLRFAGPYDNPALEVLAIRPNLQQRVGVQISGTALSPIVRLYAEPDLPDAEKLAWLVLGRSAANGGAEAALLQQAALALLGGNGKSLSGSLSEALGLDELSMRGATSSADGTTTGATVTLGKRVTRDFYVAYERSLAGTLGTFYIFYDLSRRFTLRAQTGEQSAIDLIFTLRYD